MSTVALLPIDIFLVSSTVDSHTGLKKLWADPDTIYWMTLSVQIMYYGKVFVLPIRSLCIDLSLTNFVFLCINNSILRIYCGF